MILQAGYPPAFADFERRYLQLTKAAGADPDYLQKFRETLQDLAIASEREAGAMLRLGAVVFPYTDVTLPADNLYYSAFGMPLYDWRSDAVDPEHEIIASKDQDLALLRSQVYDGSDPKARSGPGFAPGRGSGSR